MYNRKLLQGQHWTQQWPVLAGLAAAILVVAILLGWLNAAHAQSPMIVTPDGKYLGNLNSNPYDPNSVANPYGRYGNPYSPDSVNNPYGRYGSRYSPDSSRNPYTLGPSPRR